MTTLAFGTEFASRDPALVVENKLAPGVWTFQLVVVDNDGNTSAPQQLQLTIVNARIPLPTPTPTPAPSTGGGVRPTGPIRQPVILNPRVITPIDRATIIRRPS